MFTEAAQREGVKKFVAKDTSQWPDPTDKNDYEEETKPDVTIHPDTEEASRAYTIEPLGQKNEGSTVQEKVKRGSKRNGEWEARTAWSSACLCIKAKANTELSPFVLPKEAKPSGATEGAQTPSQKPKRKGKAQKDASGSPTDPVQTATPHSPMTQSIPPTAGPAMPSPPTVGVADSPTNPVARPPATGSPNAPSNPMPPFLRLDTRLGAETMGQISRYAAKMMRRQFLAYCFSVFVCCKFAWLMRWDRAGLVISEPFDFIKQPRLLHQFFYRFACMTDVQRGCDPTVVPASEEEIARMRAFADYDSGWHRDKFLGSLEEGQIMKILVPAADMITPDELKAGQKNERTGLPTLEPPREFFVGRPHFMSNSPTGSGTKGFIAYDATEDRLVFLKDCWRPEVETYHPEGEVYLHLHSHNVKYIATLVCAGDVADTQGGIHTTRGNGFLDSPPWKHYRLILKEVAMPLEEYTTSYQLVNVLYCAIQGVSAA